MRKIPIGLLALALAFLASAPLTAQPGTGPISGGGGGGGLPGANQVTEAMLKCVNSPTDEYALTYESTTGDFEWQALPTGTIGGSLGSTDNLVCRADGTGGVTIQGSVVSIADTTGAISGAQSITGGTSGTSTLVLDGDSTVSGTVTISPNGSIVTTASGTNADPAIEINGGAGCYDDWGTGGLACRFASSTGFSLLAGATYKLFLDNYRLILPSAHHIGVGTVGGSITTGWMQHSSGVWKSTNNNSGSQITSLVGGGAAVASATALPLPTGNVFHVTGTTTVTSITSTDLQSGVCVTLIFDAALTFTDGGNLKLAGDFVTTADDTLSLCYDGTNFYETDRSVN